MREITLLNLQRSQCSLLHGRSEKIADRIWKLNTSLPVCVFPILPERVTAYSIGELFSECLLFKGSRHFGNIRGDKSQNNQEC